MQATADAVPGERDNTAFSKICSSVRIAKAVPDSVLSVESARADYEAITEYEIRDLNGKIGRAVEFANAHPWEELQPEVSDLRNLSEGRS